MLGIPGCVDRIVYDIAHQSAEVVIIYHDCVFVFDLDV